jgi:hypothetical protein
MVALVLLTLAHVMPPRDVDRAMQVIVTPGEIRIDYRFGLGDEALVDELLRLDPDVEIPADPVEQARLHMNLAAEDIASRLHVRIGEQDYPVQFAKVDLIYQHHLRGSCHYTVDISKLTGKMQVQIEDRNFAAFPGHGQTAAKSRGFPFFDSDQAVILLRADRFAISTGAKFRPPTIVMQLRTGDADKGDPSVTEDSGDTSNDELPSDRETPTDDEVSGDRVSGDKGTPMPYVQDTTWTPWLIRGGMLLALLGAGVLAIRK